MVVIHKSMGGVDLLNGLIVIYRTKIKSKKWYHQLVYHFIDITVCSLGYYIDVTVKRCMLTKKSAAVIAAQNRDSIFSQ